MAVVVMVMSAMGFASLLVSLAVTVRPKIAPSVLDAYLELVQRSTAAHPATARSQARVPIMESERVVFVEESDPQRYVKLVASGEVDATLLDALSDYVKRQRKRLGPLSKDQETAIESLLMSIVNKISHPVMNQMRRFYETGEPDAAQNPQDPFDLEE